MCLLAAIMSFRGYFGHGSTIRWFRFAVFVGALWLTTPWWGRRDFMIVHFQRRAIMVVIGTVLLGLAISPTKAFANATGRTPRGNRLADSTDPSGALRGGSRRDDGRVVARGHVEVEVDRSGDRRWFGRSDPHAHPDRAYCDAGGDPRWRFESLPQPEEGATGSVVVVVVVGIGALSFAPLVTGWFARGQNSQALTQLTGRTNVWSAVLAQPRTEVNTLLGYGMSNDGFNGTSIDSSWLSTYQDQGLVGDVLDAMVLLTCSLSPSSARGSWKSCRPLFDRLLRGRILHGDRSGATVDLSLGSSRRHVAPHAPIAVDPQIRDRNDHGGLGSDGGWSAGPGPAAIRRRAS